ncbi:TadE family protein [Dankookia sp. GCM10030260]|uniref:TadE family protein n=1 Tax=Dankookia sp. GCM10030260 TaxID=3273390 RepID=UPI003608D34D
MLRRIGHHGIAATEFAVVAPVLLLLLLGSFDIANLVQTSIRLERAARAGAQFATASATDMEAIRGRVIAAWPELTMADVPTPALACECSGVTVACSETCAGGVVRIITVTAQRSLSPYLLQAASLGRGSAVVRLR